MPYTVLMPIFADQILHGGARGLGILMSATGLGALAASLFLASRSNVRGLGRLTAIASTGFGVSMMVFAFSPYFWLSAAALVPTGGFMMLQNASANTLLQAMVPDQLRGRVMALYSMMFMGVAPIGSLFAGVVADRAGAPGIALYSTGLALMAAAAWISRFPRMSVGLGALMFVASDLLIFARAGPLEHNPWVGFAIWALYFAGQLRICLGVAGTLARRDP